MIENVPNLLRKIFKYRPRMVCILGKGIWQIFINEAVRPPESTLVPPTLTSRFFSPTSTPGPSTSSTPITANRYFPKAPVTPASTPPTLSPYFSKGLNTPPATPPTISPYFSHTHTPPTPTMEPEDEDEYDPDVLPSFEPTPKRKKRKKSVYTAKQLSAYGWGLQPFKIVHSEPQDGKITLSLIQSRMPLICCTQVSRSLCSSLCPAHLLGLLAIRYACICI